MIICCWTSKLANVYVAKLLMLVFKYVGTWWWTSCCLLWDFGFFSWRMNICKHNWNTSTCPSLWTRSKWAVIWPCSCWIVWKQHTGPGMNQRSVSANDSWHADSIPNTEHTAALVSYTLALLLDTHLPSKWALFWIIYNSPLLGYQMLVHIFGL